MADKDLRSTHRRVNETSFGGDNGGIDNDEFLLVRADQPPVDDREREAEVQHQPSSSADVFMRAKQPGLITRIGRGVKSAVGGAINIFVGNSNHCVCTY